MKTFLIVFISVLAVLLAIVLGGSYYMYRFAIVRSKKSRNYWNEELKRSPGISEEIFEKMKAGERIIKSMKWERVTVKSHDGLTLVGRLYEHPESRGIFIMVHGYRSAAVHDFSCAVGPISSLGFSLLLIDHRAHGESEGKHIGFGVTERYDLIEWAKYLGERYPDLPVILDGVSMGASTIMMGGEIGYPDNVKALVCDCGYTTPGKICKVTMKRWFGLPPFPVYYIAKALTRAFAGYDFDGTSSINGLEKIKEKKTPIIIAHGRADGFVPFYMGEENYAAVEGDSAEFFVSDKADHGQAYLCDFEGYTAAMERLFKKANI